MDVGNRIMSGGMNARYAGGNRTERSASRPENPSELFYQPAAADSPRQLTQANTALLDEVIVQPTQEMRFPSADGQEIQGWYTQEPAPYPTPPPEEFPPEEGEERPPER